MAATAALVACAPIPSSPTPPAARAITGTVRLEVVGAQSGITVTLSGPGGSQTSQTDANGQYKFSNLNPGTYQVTAHIDKYFDQSTTVNLLPDGGQAAPLTLANHQVILADTTMLGRSNMVLTPDGGALAYVQGSQVMKVSTTGGSPSVVCSLPLNPGESVAWIDWSATNNRLLFARNASPSFEIDAIKPDGTGTQRWVSGTTYALTTPVWSPAADKVAYLRDRTTQIDASGSGHVDLLVTDASGSTQNVETNPINPIYQGIEPLQWNRFGLLYHRAMTCNTISYKVDPDNNKPVPVRQAGDGIYFFTDIATDPIKVFYYSYEGHCWSLDGQSILIGIGGSVRRRAVNYPGDYRSGTVTVGNTRYDDKRCFTLGPDGTLYFISPAGIERMSLLG
jgi:hypothetical protein